MPTRTRNRISLGIVAGVLFPLLLFWVIWEFVLESLPGLLITLVALLVFYVVRNYRVPEISGTVARWGARMSFLVTAIVGGFVLIVSALVHLLYRLVAGADPEEAQELEPEDVELLATASEMFQPIHELVFVIGAGLPDEISVRGVNAILIVTLLIYLELSTWIIRPWRRFDAWRHGSESGNRQEP